MADLRISDAQLLSQDQITGAIKLPTGGKGNYAIKLSDLAWYVVNKENLTDVAYVDTAISNVSSALQAQITDMATKTYVGQQDSLKADISYVDSELLTKADVSYVDNKLGTKADVSSTYTKNEVDTKIGSISGGYFGAYATLANLQSTTGMVTGQVAKVMNDGTSTNNGDYYYNGSAWVKGYSVLQDAKNYTDEKVSFAVYTPISYNLLNLNKITEGVRLDLNGSTYANTSYFTSGYIPVNPNVTYKINYAGRIAFYDINKVYISTSDTSATATAPTNAYYARASFATADKTTKAMFAELEKYPTKYQAYDEKIVIQKLMPQPKKVVDKSDTSFLVRTSPNLFNPDTATQNAYLNRYTDTLVSPYDGVTSDYIEVKPSTTYSQTEGNYFIEYDQYKNMVIGHNTGETTFITASNTKYVRVTVRNAIIGSYILNDGSVLQAYQTYNKWQLDSSISTSATQASRWKGKKWAVLGDSITADANSYWRKIASDKGFSTTYNHGIGGTSIAYRDAPADYPNPELFTQQWMANRYVNMPDDADLVTIAGGTNDFKQVPLGSFAVRDNSTVYGALRTLCEGLIDKYSTATFGAILPFHRYDSLTAYNPYTFMQLRAVMLEVYDFYGFAVFDSTRRLNAIRFYDVDNRNAFTNVSVSTKLPDGLHPNKTAHEQYIAPVIGDWLEGIAPKTA